MLVSVWLDTYKWHEHTSSLSATVHSFNSRESYLQKSGTGRWGGLSNIWITPLSFLDRLSVVLNTICLGQDLRLSTPGNKEQLLALATGIQLLKWQALSFLMLLDFYVLLDSLCPHFEWLVSNGLALALNFLLILCASLKLCSVLFMLGLFEMFPFPPIARLENLTTIQNVHVFNITVLREIYIAQRTPK